MAVSTHKVHLSGLARKLVVDGLLQEQAAVEAFQDAIKKKQPFVSYLVERRLADSLAIAQAAAEEFGVPLIDINSVDLDIEVTRLLKEDLLKKHHALPLYKRGKRLYVAVSDPTNLQALDEIKFAVGMSADAILVEENKLVKAIDHAIEAAEGGLGDMAESDFDDLDDLEVAGHRREEEEPDTDVDDAPVVRFVNKVMLDAIRKGASDIHFEPYEKYYRVRFRMDGVLTEVARPPISLALKMAARIKVMSRLDVSERRVPQDGRIKLKLSRNKAMDFRVSTCPTLYGEKVVLRLLDSSSALLGIDMLGYEDFQKDLFLENLHRPYGMFLVTGPTGSGKTVSLYTGISILNQTEVNISTVEDPVEINLPGINQVQVDERTGLTFAKALKAFLRQDPDIILVGEVRDIETGGIALKAAMTGHMVMSTLHTNDAPQTLTRLQDMGLPVFGISTAVNIIIAQRLARRLCKNCLRPIEMPPPEALLEEGFTDQQIEAGVKLSTADGCDQCNAGYKGRTGIYQVMPLSESMRRLIMDGATAIQLADQAKAEGIPDIRESALKKVADGITDLKEINRVTQD